MIATILPSTSNFHAVEYNEKKRAAGDAVLLETHNIPEAICADPSMEKFRDFFIDYSFQKNDRIEKPQFHVAISCKGQELTEEELLEFAHEWLREMGYDNEGQPWLIYAHRDTDNAHVHIITSRVDPQGRKISDSHERRRSQAAIDKILGINAAKKAEADLKTTLEYSFESVSQFRAVMDSMGYKGYQKGERMYFTKGGSNKCSISMDEINNGCKADFARKEELAKLRAIFSKYHPLAIDLKSFSEEMKSKFGLSLVFYGSKDKPYGYSIVDHNKKKVFRGQRVMDIEQLLDIMPLEERFERIDTFVDDRLEIDPLLGMKELKKLLRRHFGAILKDGRIFCGENSIPLKQTYIDLLEYNDRVNWANMFKPTTDAERELMARLTKCEKEDVGMFTVDGGQADSINRYAGMLHKGGYQGLKKAMEDEGFRIFKTAGTRIAVTSKRMR